MGEEVVVEQPTGAHIIVEEPRANDAEQGQITQQVEENQHQPDQPNKQ